MRMIVPYRSTTKIGAPKASVVNRVVAKILDILLVCLIAGLLPYPAGPLLGFVYSLLGDGIHFGPLRGQSFAKKLLRLRVINTKTGKPASWRESVLRNSPVGVATFFAIIPVWGWVVLFLIGIPLMAMEIYLMLTAENGHRLGDLMADTEVVSNWTR